MNDVSIDLVVDKVATGGADIVKPANRLDIKGIPVFDYLIYPAANAIADKVCATLQTYPNGRASSRVRDLVDIVVYLTTETLNGHNLSVQLALEARLRHLEPLTRFEIPDAWRTNLSRSYAKSAKEAKLPVALQDVEEAEQLAKSCINPAIAREVEDALWSPETLGWEKQSRQATKQE